MSRKRKPNTFYFDQLEEERKTEEKTNENDKRLTALSGIVEAENTCEEKRAPRTREQYAVKSIHICNFFKAEYPAMYDDSSERVIIEKVTLDALKDCFGTICKKDDGEYKCESYINQYKSIVVQWFEDAGIEKSIHVLKFLSNFCTGYKKKRNKLKHEGVIDDRSKEPISFCSYRNIALKLINTEDGKLSARQLLYSHCYLVLSWNSSCRTVSISDLLYQHISWNEDSLILNFNKTKTNQSGESRKNIRMHMYANPIDPIICPILALGLLVLSSSSYGHEVFPSSCEEANFSNHFRDAVKRLDKNIRLEQGIEDGSLGTHSIRKGVMSRMGGLVAGPPPANIHMRAGQSIGSIFSLYLHQQSGGDQYSGRIASGLPVYETNFALLPPHFSEMGSILSAEEWNTILPNYENYPSGFKLAIPFLVASVAFHKDWIISEFNNDHPFFNSRFFTGNYLNRLNQFVKVGVFYNKESKLQATGIPPHIIYKKDMAELFEAIKILTEKVDNLSEKMESASTNTSTSIAAPNHDIQALIDGFSSVMNNLQNSASSISNHTAPTTQENQHNWNFLDGNNVPQHFTWPSKLTVSLLWDRWFFGVNYPNYCKPYKCIQAKELRSDQERKNLSKAKKVIKCLTFIATTNNIVPHDSVLNNLTINQSTEVFKRIFPLFCEKFKLPKANKSAYDTEYVSVRRYLPKNLE